MGLSLGETLIVFDRPLDHDADRAGDQLVHASRSRPTAERRDARSVAIRSKVREMRDTISLWQMRRIVAES